MYKKLILSAAAIVGSSSIVYADTVQLYAGATASPDSYYGYLGAVGALNGDIGKDGFLVRASGAYGSYEYSRPGATDVDGDIYAGDLMLGYQTFFGADTFLSGGRATLYLGGDYQNHDLTPVDPLNRVNGTEAGFKSQAELALNVTRLVSLGLAGSYSTAYESYWSRAQLGYAYHGVTFGPEAAFMGNEAYDNQRYGAFLKDIAISQSVSMGVAGGYSHASRRGDSGVYGELSLSTTF